MAERIRCRAEMTGVYGGIHLRLRGKADGTVQVTRDFSGAFREPEHSPVSPWEEGEWERTAEENWDVFFLSGLQIRVNRRSGALSFLNREGKLLLQERDPGPAELQETEIRRSVFRPDSVRETMGVDGARAAADPVATEKDRQGVRGRQHFEFREGEALYGLGSHEEGYGNLRGRSRLLYQHNLKAVVPVLISTEGWGILFDMGCGMRFRDDGEGSFMEIDCADALNWYFLPGEEGYASVMEKLQGLVGAAPMLPRYALGFTQSKERYVSAEELTEVSAEYRRRKVPLDLIVQDWQTWPEGQWGFKQLDRSRFPEGFVKPIHGMNVRVMISVWPNLQGEKNGDREELLREGCMLGNRSTYNAFDPKAREIYWNQIRRGLLGEGIDAFWCDCTEPFECDWHGEERPSDEERMRVNTEEAKKYLDPTEISLYSLCHSRGIWEGLRRDRPEQRVLNVTRSSWAGQRRYGAVTWSGDVCATWETLRRHVPEGLNFTAAGEPFWNCDIGGFFTNAGDPWFWKGDFPGGTEDPGYRELYVRWSQYACFLTMMRSHGTDTPREIWRFGEEDGEYYEALKRCIRMRYRLLAYQYSLYAETCRTGMPALRVPALVFPEDRRLREIDNEMMLGDGILVCPVTRPMYYLPGGRPVQDPDETVEVRLPGGEDWYAPDDGTAYAGRQTVTVKAPLDRIPVFVRAGTILPVSPVRQYTEEETEEPTEILVFPGKDGRFVLYDDDGISYGYEKGCYQRIPMAWNDREGILTLEAQEGAFRKEQRLSVRRFGKDGAAEIRYRGEPVTVRI